MVPLSFVLACLLNLDSTRSPIVPKIDAINEITSKLVRDKKSQKYETKNAVINVKNTPPKKPSIVFLVKHFQIISFSLSSYQQKTQSYH